MKNSAMSIKGLRPQTKEHPILKSFVNAVSPHEL
jgi:hypothetical protein